jgi:hypothetical protein
MPQQLIYTSAPRGLVPGRSGYCTVARTAAMREPLVLRLEQLSYYLHVSLAGGRERLICACRVVDIRGARFHVLSRIQDAGLDFTGRTNFIAHHLVVTPVEIGQLPVPALILRDWPGWVKSWSHEPQMIANEDWSGLTALATKTALPAVHWQRLTGDAVNGYGLLETNAGATLGAGSLEDDVVLGLLAESEELLEVRAAGRDYRAAAWQYTFTTSLQEQDIPADFRWRILRPDSPVFARLGGPDCPALASLRALCCGETEAALARSGKKPPSFRLQPQDLQVAEGSPAKLQAEAEGIPTPSYQWYSVDRAEKLQLLPGETGPELVLRTPPVGVSRYKVTATNSLGELLSRVVVLSVEPRMRLQHDMRSASIPEPPQSDAPYIQSEEKIEKQRNRLLAEKAEQSFYKKQKRRRIVAIIGVLLISVVAAIIAKWIVAKNTQNQTTNPRNDSTNLAADSGTSVPQTAPPPASNSILGLANSATNVESSAPQPPRILGEPDYIALPATWTAVKVGSGSIGLFAAFTNGAFTIASAGKGIEKPDCFLFVHQPATNSVTFSVRLDGVERGSLSSRCGIMMRGSTNADAPFVFLGSSTRMGFFACREATGQAIRSQHAPSANHDIFLQLIRQQNQFTGLISGNGINWEPIGEPWNAKLPETNYLLGFAVWSGNSDEPVKARFDTVTISPPQSAR